MELEAGLSYCFNYSTYDIALQGLPMVEKIKSVAPKWLLAFKSQVEQFVIIAANSTLGATGLADFLIVMSLYVDKIFRSGRDAHFYFPGWFSDEELERQLNGEEIDRTEPYNKKVFESNVWKYVEENLVSFIYTVNQPGRGNQSPFTNVSVYSDSFLDQMLESYSLEGYPANKDTVKKIQKVYLEAFNKELQRTQITFPVLTACFSINDDNEIPGGDEEFLDMIAEQNLQFGFINIYCGKTSTLSSCCRLRSDTENRFFNEEKFYEIELEDGTIKKVSSKETVKVKNLDTGEIENMYIDEIKDKTSMFEIVE